MVWNALVIVTVLLPLAGLAIDVPRCFALRSRLQIARPTRARKLRLAQPVGDARADLAGRAEKCDGRHEGEYLSKKTRGGLSVSAS